MSANLVRLQMNHENLRFSALGIKRLGPNYKNNNFPNSSATFLAHISFHASARCIFYGVKTKII